MVVFFFFCFRCAGEVKIVLFADRKLAQKTFVVKPYLFFLIIFFKSVSSMSSKVEENWEGGDSEDDGSVLSGYSSAGILRYEAQPLQDGVLAPGAGCFTFMNPATLKDVTVYYIKSKKYRPEDPPVFVFHGVYRNPDVYRDAWVDLAEQYGFFVVAPFFTSEQFPGAAGYNLGNIFVSEEDRTPKEERNWSYYVPDAVFKYLSAEAGKGDTCAHGYVAYGHSAGSQFLHRKVAITPDPHLLMAIASNAGWSDRDIFLISKFLKFTAL